MNVSTSALRLEANAPRQIFVASHNPSRQPRRARDFGVGYGSSSGYATPRRYIADNGPRLFRLN